MEGKESHVYMWHHTTTSIYQFWDLGQILSRFKLQLPTSQKGNKASLFL